MVTALKVKRVNGVGVGGGTSHPRRQSSPLSSCSHLVFTDSPSGPSGPSGPVKTFPPQFSRQYCSDNSSPCRFVSFCCLFSVLTPSSYFAIMFLEISVG